MKKKAQEPKKTSYRQGDILILSCEGIPKNARLERGVKKGVLAEGEATGHFHTIEAVDGVDHFKRGDQDQWLEVKQDSVDLIHPEHATINIPSGKYEIRRQREYREFNITYVAD